MINISKLYCGVETSGDGIRYGTTGTVPEKRGQSPSAADRRPVVVWSITRKCNLRCIHCYTDSEIKDYTNELSTEEGKRMIDDLAGFGIPALLISGGEPLTRKDVFELATYARDKGVRCTLSTNGTLITANAAKKIKEAGFTYVGISLDGMEATNDRFRGVRGAFKKAMEGFKNCREVGQKTGLRLTLTKKNYEDLDEIFDFIEREEIGRACFYHLVYAGRGAGLKDADLTHKETRHALDIILKRTSDFTKRGLNKDILTVDNHVDTIYLYLKLLAEKSPLAEETLKFMQWNQGGNFSSGVGIGNIDFVGNVHPDQFWMHYTLGNVRKRPFSEIWLDTKDPLLAKLKNRKSYLKGKCGACKWKDLCGGSFRVRADFVYKDPFAPDPACYLTNEECGITPEKVDDLRNKGDWFEIPPHT